jgi:CheY-like chemotaxis protein/two-component sensor histidine kinase
MLCKLDSFEEKDNKSAGANHDIKALANGVFCMSSLLEGTPLSIEQAEIVQLLKKSAEELGAIMGRMLDQNQADVTQPKLTNFNVNETLEAIFKTFRLTIQEKPIELKLKIEGKVPSTVRGDKTALHRILSNLLHNAGKFTHAGKIELYVSSEKRLNNQVVLTFSVLDTGIGIKKENQEKIFTHFTKFNSDGYGLGLANAQDLVIQNGGAISVESEEGIGTTFRLSLPYEIAQFKASQKVAYFGVSALKGVKILVADDDNVYIKYLSTILNQSKAQLTIVKTGREALTKALNQAFDIILLDLRLPDLDGYDAAFQIRNTVNANRDIPILGMSAAGADREKAIICRITDILPKPLNTEGLVSRIHQALAAHKKGDNIAKETLTDAFYFDKRLDSEYLLSLYGNDIEHAEMMFETFLDESLPHWSGIMDAVGERDILLIKGMAHRFKPAVSMVGLTDIEKILVDLEKNISRYTHSEIKNIITLVNDKIGFYMPILKKELERLKSTIQVIAA